MIQHFLNLFILQIIIVVLKFLLFYLEVGEYFSGLGGPEGFNIFWCWFSLEFQ